MIEVICDDCEKRFEVGDDQRGQKVKCPHCGDVARVPGAAPGAVPGVAGREDRAAARGLPSALGPEMDVMVVRPAMLRARPISYFGLVLVFLGGLAGIVWGVMKSEVWWVVGGVGGVVGSVGVLGYWRLVKKNTRLRITTKRCIETAGVFGKSSSEILHKDIRNFTVKQSFWERVWGVGTIGISSAAEDETEIVMHDVARPWKVHEAIDVYREM